MESPSTVPTITASTSPQASAGTGPTSVPGQPPGLAHTRTYQACIPCRRRKVRCDLGPVDNPHDPPCVRCRRESKECYFSATRRKRKPAADAPADEVGDLSDYEIRNSRKKARAEDDNGEGIGIDIDDEDEDIVTGAGYRRQPLRRGEARAPTRDRPSTGTGLPSASASAPADRQATEAATRVLTNTEVFSGHHALAMLYQAAQTGELQDAERRRRSGRSQTVSVHRGSFGSERRPQHTPTEADTNQPVEAAGERAILDSPTSGARLDRRSVSERASSLHQRSHPDLNIDNDVTVAEVPPSTSSEPASDRIRSDVGLEAWSRFRFVHQGWFTAREGIQYMDYYFSHLAPLSAVPVPDYSDPATHEELLTTEPMLTITLLTIASRYMPLTGPGSRSRPHAIHEVLWKCLREMIDRLLWGQEQFGGGFCGAGGGGISAGAGAGSLPGCDVNPLARTGLRTLGSVVSLVVLTEWHPRGLHFPPGSDGDTLMFPADGTGSRATIVDSAGPVFVNGTAGQPMASWLEPCWRSDRMCWMLLGLAKSLAYEIGVYNEAVDADDVLAQENEDLPVSRVRSYVRHRRHVRETLQIYFSQTAGRLGLTSMLPASILSGRDEQLEHRLRSRLAAFQAEDRLGASDHDQAEALGQADNDVSRLPQYEFVLHFWSALADLMELGNALMFPNRRRTRDLIKTQQYKSLLDDKFHPLLRSWRAGFDAQSSRIPVLMRHVILIEYEYARVYLNSLSLQAVVERCTHDSPPLAFAAPVLGRSEPRRGPVPYADLMAWCGNDRRYIQEVTDACRATLEIAVDGLYGDGGNLKHAPVRTYFRIISVAIILLKTFVLGATEDEVSYSLSLLERCTAAFRVCIVDDVHVSSRFADLCDTLTARIRSRFVRLSATGGAVRRRRRRKSVVLAGPDLTESSPQPSSAQPSGRLRGPTSRSGAGLTRLSDPVSATSQTNSGSVLTPNTPGPFLGSMPTLQPILSSGAPLWRIPGNFDTMAGSTTNATTATTAATAAATGYTGTASVQANHVDDFPAVNILPPPGLSLVYGEDDGLVLGGHMSESEQSGSQSSHPPAQMPPSVTSPAIPLTPTMTPVQPRADVQRPDSGRAEFGPRHGFGPTHQQYGQLTPHTPHTPQQGQARGHGHGYGAQQAHPHPQQQQQPQQPQQPPPPPAPLHQTPAISDAWDHWDQNWLVLPIDPILGSYGANVSQTTYGPDIGGLDMLDVLLPFVREDE